MARRVLDGFGALATRRIRMLDGNRSWRTRLQGKSLGMQNEQATHTLPRAPTVQFATVSLAVVAGPDRGRELRLAPGTTRIGTAASCQLVLTDDTVSRVHCEIRVEVGTVRIVDLGSTNGTFVDGIEVLEVKLAAGCTLAVGKSTIRIEIGAELVNVTLSTRDGFGAVLGSSASMRRVYSMMERVAPTDTTVLITGETGTGKELVARAIHEVSPRAKTPFIAVDCGAIAENLIESELFGHLRGAFTGAQGDRKGLFEEASGGTIFLDEVGELPMSLQPKLLRVLDSREVRRVGSNTAQKVDVRVLAATNRPLARNVNDGSFRDDLYYRLAVVEIELPPLRARREDIPILATDFYSRMTGQTDALAPELLMTLMARGWPGNVRELRNFMERSVCLGWSASQGPDGPTSGGPPLPILESLMPVHLPMKEARDAWNGQFESLYVGALLQKTGGNVTRAAELAGVSRRYIHRLIAEHGLDRRKV
jgi:DNA-binding NtrC family response regulator